MRTKSTRTKRIWANSIRTKSMRGWAYHVCLLFTAGKFTGHRLLYGSQSYILCLEQLSYLGALFRSLVNDVGHWSTPERSENGSTRRRNRVHIWWIYTGYININPCLHLLADWWIFYPVYPDAWNSVDQLYIPGYFFLYKSSSVFTQDLPNNLVKDPKILCLKKEPQKLQ